MIIIGQQEKMYKCFSVVEKGLPAKTTLPVLNGILLDANEEFLRMITSNLELTVQARDDHVHVLEKGRVVLPPKIVEIIKQLNSQDEVKINMKEEEMRVEITSGTALFILYGMDAAEFPNIVKEEEWLSWEKLEFFAADFKEMFSKIIFAVSRDEGRPLFRAVHLNFEGNGKLNAVATDTYRLARVKRFYDGTADSRNLKFLIPGRTLNEILRVLEDSSNEKVTCYFTENDLIFCYRQFIFSSRLIEGRYPDVSGVFPEIFKTRIGVDKGKIEKLLKRAVLLAHGQNQMILIKIIGNVLHVSASSDSGRMEEELILDQKEGEDLDGIMINARFFTDPLPLINDEKIIIDFNGPLGPCIFHCDHELNGAREIFDYLVLPIKTDKRS